MGRIAKRRQNNRAGKAGATHSSQEKQDDGVTQGTSPGRNHQDADGNLDIHAHDAHDNDDNADCAENDNSNIAATTNGDDRPDVHGHEGEDVYNDIKEGHAGVQTRTQASQEKQDDGVSQGLPHQENHKDEDTNPDSHAHDAHDKNIHSDSDKNNTSDVALSTNGEDRPELQNHAGQTGDQPRTQASQEKQDDGVQQDLPPQENHEGQASDQLPGEDENNGNNNVEDDNNGGDGAVPLAPNISPQFDSKDLYKVLGVPMNVTEQQIMSAYHNLAKKHHPDCIPIHLSKDDANRIFSFINNAYEILGNTEKRRVHDASLRIGEVINVDEEGNDNEDRDDHNNSDDDDGRNVDEDRPPEKYSSSFPCDWQNIHNFCHTPGMQPFKCQTDGCDKWAHQICQRLFEINNGHHMTFIPKCCMHHPHSPFTATKPSTPNVEGEQQPEHVSINTSSSEFSSFSKSSESSSSSSSPEIPTMKGGACSMFGKEETIRQARMQAQCKNLQPEQPLPSPLRKGSAFSASGKEEAF
jgi:curved DNA-binding protein CbpA